MALCTAIAMHHQVVIDDTRSRMESVEFRQQAVVVRRSPRNAITYTRWRRFARQRPSGSIRAIQVAM